MGRVRNPLIAAAFVAVVVTTGACGPRPPGATSEASDTPAPSSAAPETLAPATALPGTPAPNELELSYTCSREHPFSPTLFNEPAIDLRSHPAGAVLADYIEAGEELEPEMLPLEGWRLAGEDEFSVTFVAPRTGDPPYAWARLRNDGSGWRFTGGGDCRPTISLQGAGAATWVLAPGREVEPESTTFEAAVTERACTGGSSSEGRIREPLIIYEPDRVVVIFTVDPLPGGAYTCPGNPPTLVTVELSEPLGDRQLLDGGEFPWRDATKREPWQR